MDKNEAIEILRKGYPDINRYAASELEAYEHDVEAYNEVVGYAISHLEKDRWISVKDNLPDKNDFVLVYDGSDMFVAWYENEGMSEGWHSFDDTYDRFTPIIAWRPLPKAPESEDK